MHTQRAIFFLAGAVAVLLIGVATLKPTFQDVSAPEPAAFPFSVDPPTGWFVNRTRGHVLITRHETLPEIGATEGYAYGEQIDIERVPFDGTTDQWVKDKRMIDLDDVLVRRVRRYAVAGFEVIEAEHETPADMQLTRFLFAPGSVYIVSLYPAPSHGDASTREEREQAFAEVFDQNMRRAPEIRDALAENCLQDISAARIDDTSVNIKTEIAEFFWTENGENRRLAVPLSPGSEGRSCSPSVHAKLAHVVTALPFDDQMRYCEAVPNDSERTVQDTARMFIHLPIAYFPDADTNMRGWRTVSGDATAGYVSNGGRCEGNDVKQGCWSCYFQFEGGGVVEYTAMSADQSVPPYHVRVMVKTAQPI